MKTIVAAAFAGVLALSPLAVRADTSPFMNRVIVNDALQQQMQNRLNIQQTTLQTQQDLTRLRLQSQLQQQQNDLQYLLLQQQLQLLRLEQMSGKRSSVSHPKKPHS